MAVTQASYPAAQVEAARSVLVELAHLLGEYRDSVVLVGGWVPQLLLNSPDDRHVGSVDVDLALDHRTFPESGYETVQRLLASRGYVPDDAQPFIFRDCRRTRDHEQIDQVSGIGQVSSIEPGHGGFPAEPDRLDECPCLFDFGGVRVEP